MLSYILGIKTLALIIAGNGYGKSGLESWLRRPVNSEKVRRVTVTMFRLTKLIRFVGVTLSLVRNISGKGTSLIGEISRMYNFSAITVGRRSYKDIESQRAKVTHGGIKGTTGCPKGRKPYGYRGLVVGSKNQRGLVLRGFSSKSVINPSGRDMLKELTKLKGSIPGIIHYISNLEILIIAYESIKSKPGNMTPGADGETLDGISRMYLENVSKTLKAGTFEFSPARRVYIPKAGKKELRPLGVVSPRDKIVQTAILMVLEAIYDGTFSKHSHGFRPKRSCHTALEDIKFSFAGIVWVIEGDISKCYDTIDHGVLLNLMRNRINCDKTISLVKKSLTNSYWDERVLVKPKLGTFQGSSLSPLLCNIYLHEFDRFLESYKNRFDKGRNRRKNPDYRRLQYEKEKATSLEEKRKISIKMKKLPSKDLMDPNFKRLQFVRYADDFVVGVIGNRADCLEIRDNIKTFLEDKLKLRLSIEKSKISNFNKEGFMFLSTYVKGPYETEKLVKKIEIDHRVRKVRVTGRPRMEAPIEVLLKRAEANNFFKRLVSGRWVPTACRRVVNLDHADILRFFNQKVRGILNYYSFVDNKKSLGSVIHGLKHSCALTLALKFKARHRFKMFARFGKTLRCPTTEIEFFLPPTFSRDQQFNKSAVEPGEILDRRWNNKLSRSNLRRSCLVCGKYPCEMHHVRRIKDLKEKYSEGKLDFWTMQMAAINRKQIPLCKDHHEKLHNNKLTPQESEWLKKGLMEFD